MLWHIHRGKEFTSTGAVPFDTFPPPGTSLMRGEHPPRPGTGGSSVLPLAQGGGTQELILIL
eukprot:14337978-Ditylum_brightwellii.AAC.1